MHSCSWLFTEKYPKIRLRKQGSQVHALYISKSQERIKIDLSLVELELQADG